MDWSPPPKIWTPPKPAIVRAASLKDIAPFVASFLPGMAGVNGMAGGAVRYTTWNSADKTSGMTLSGGDLVASFSGAGHQIVRAVKGMSSGKWYWEIVASSLSGTFSFGISKAGAAGYCGADANGWGALGNNGGNFQAFNNASSAYTSGTTLGNGDVAMMAFDADAGKLYFGKAGTWYNSGDPVAGTGAIFTSLTSGPYYATGSDGSSGSDTGTLTANFGASAFAHTPPTGFTGITT